MPRRTVTPKRTEVYQHEDRAVLRPEAGTQAQFKTRREPERYRYDDSLSPALDWDGQNPSRELGEWLLSQIEDAASLPDPHIFPEPRSFGDVIVGGLADAIYHLKRLSGPFLNWAGKAERLSFDVPTLPLFVHERLSTKAILETLKAHERNQQLELQLFGDPQLSLAQQLEAYEHTGGWVNRMILGDSLIVMNSLVEYEGLGRQVQMIYMDPPYGVKFGSNFQPFIRKRDVRDGSDGDMTREPEMVKAYRDTWELGVHSYLTYLQDRLLLARELLAPTGSVFIQIGEDNVHRVRLILDQIFGEENYCSQIIFRKTTGKGSALVDNTYDVLLWYAKDREMARSRFHPLFRPRLPSGDNNYRFVELPDGTRRTLSKEELVNVDNLPGEWRVFRHNPLTSQSASTTTLFEYEFEGNAYRPGKGGWKTNLEGMRKLDQAGRLFAIGKTLGFVRFFDDFPFQVYNDIWDDTRQSGFGEQKIYAVQTAPRVVEHCMLMTTDPGDLVLDPTCGSGTTAYVAEQWGRRWITIDTSRVPIALARQRLLTATYPYYELQGPSNGPAEGFIYERRQNRRGQEVGGIQPHLMLESIANDEPAVVEVLVDVPEKNRRVTRVTGPFCVEATIPTPLDEAEAAEPVPDNGAFADRLLEVLRRNPTLSLGANRTVTLSNIRPPSKSLTLSAEAMIEAEAVALVFGSENGSISERLIFEGAREAHARSFEQVIFIGFAIEAGARDLVEKSGNLVGIPASYVQATPDLVMGDLLKTMRSSQIFSVTGLPDVAVRKFSPEKRGDARRYQVELRGLDVFDPTTMQVDHRDGTEVPAWFLDTDYNEMCFLVCQAFFPRTNAWENIKKSLNGEYEDSVWDHLAGTMSEPFMAGERRKIAVKVIDDRGNELLVVKSLDGLK